jgi:hypothetical protein
MKELTYILGAGASYQSIPVVKTFVQRFAVFQGHLWGAIQEGYFDSKNYSEIDQLGKEFANAIASHQSFDTFFKKLFHLGQKDKILQFKKILNLYFLWEHLVEPKAEDDKDAFQKTASIDKRYDALIAALLKPIEGKAELFCKVNFISWNYDMNLLASIKQYFYPNDTYAALFEKLQEKSRAEWIFNEKLTVVNMNGFFYSHLFDGCTTLQGLGWKEMLSLAIKNWTDNDMILQKDAERIRFAWEGMSENLDKPLKHVELAREKVRNSNKIVVIGYTFPLYNRLADFYYGYEMIPSWKDKFVQDPDSNVIADRVKAEFLHGNGYIGSISDCESFYVPKGIVDLSNLKSR